MFTCFYACKNKNLSHQSNQIEQNYEVIDSTINNTEFVFIPKGKFTFGLFDEVVDLPYDYWIMKYEVTNQQYYDFSLQALAKGILQTKGDTLVYAYDGDRVRPAGTYTAKILDDRIYLEDGKLQLDSLYAQHPVTEITWFGATAYCNFYDFQLPSEQEWEKAARGATGWNYPWGDDLESNRANYHNSGDPYDNGTTPVGFYNGQTYKNYKTKDSPSVYGCYDMAGNAWEYTNTQIFKDYAFLEGGGGGYLYHTGAMVQSWFRSTIGLPFPIRIDRPFVSDGFRCVKK